MQQHNECELGKKYEQQKSTLDNIILFIYISRFSSQWQNQCVCVATRWSYVCAWCISKAMCLKPHHNTIIPQKCRHLISLTSCILWHSFLCTFQFSNHRQTDSQTEKDIAFSEYHLMRFHHIRHHLPQHSVSLSVQ